MHPTNATRAAETICERAVMKNCVICRKGTRQHAAKKLKREQGAVGGWGGGGIAGSAVQSSGVTGDNDVATTNSRVDVARFEEADELFT